MGYHEGEEAFAKLAAAPGANLFSTELELAADGYVTMKIALPDSGSNAGTALAHVTAEMLGFTTSRSNPYRVGRYRYRADERRMVRRQNHYPARSGHL